MAFCKQEGFRVDGLIFGIQGFARAREPLGHELLKVNTLQFG